MGFKTGILPVAIVLCLPASAQAGSETYADLIETYAQVTERIQEDRITEARELVAKCKVPNAFPGRHALNEIDALLRAAQRSPASSSGNIEAHLQKNNYPIGAIASLSTLVSHDLQRMALLNDNSTPAAELERRVMIESSKAIFAVLDYLARLPVGHDDAWSAGLLHAGGALLGIEELLADAGMSTPVVTYVAEQIDANVDPISAMRLGRGWVLLQSAGGPTSELTRDPRSDLLVLGWVAMSAWVAPRTRGEAALLGLDLVDKDTIWSQSNVSSGDRALFRLWFVEAATGTSDACEPKRPDPIYNSELQLAGGTPAQADLAAARMFSWQSGLDGNVHKLTGHITSLDLRAQQTLLCHVTMRAESRASVPAALALAERVFYESHLGASLATDDKSLAYSLALTAIRNAATLRDLGQIPTQDWWVQDFGELLVPLLNPLYAPTTSNDVKFLEEWAREESSDWLVGRLDAPVWMNAVPVAEEEDAAFEDQEMLMQLSRKQPRKSQLRTSSSSSLRVQ